MCVYSIFKRKSFPMKNKNHFLLAIAALMLIFSSCEKDAAEKDIDPNIEDNTCMEYVDLHATVNNAKQIFFINDNEGWMIGFSKDQSAPNAILLHTSDGGQTWSIINNDLDFGFAIGMTDSKFKFYFTDATHGYICIDLGTDTTPYNEYYYTDDKGVSWNPVPLPSNSDDVSIYYGMAANSTQMVFAARVNPPYPAESYNALYFVSNASHTITSEVSISSPDDYQLTKRDIHFTDAGVINMQVEKIDQVFMAHSADYGASWTYTEIDYRSKALTYMEFVTDDIGYLPVDMLVFGPTQPFYKTTDGGATWTQKTIDADNGKNGTSFSHFAFADANNGLAIRTSSNALYKTTDGGNSWARVACFTDENYDFDIYTSPLSIVYPSVNKGIVLSSFMDVDASEMVDTYQNRVYFYAGE